MNQYDIINVLSGWSLFWVMAEEKFIAYFAILGLGDSLTPAVSFSGKYNDISSEQGYNTIVGEANEDEKMIYNATIEDRFPLEDYEDAPLPEHLPVVCS